MVKKLKRLLRYIKLRNIRIMRKENEEYIKRKGFNRCLKDLQQ